LPIFLQDQGGVTKICARGGDKFHYWDIEEREGGEMRVKEGSREPWFRSLAALVAHYQSGDSKLIRLMVNPPIFEPKVSFNSLSLSFRLSICLSTMSICKSLQSLSLSLLFVALSKI
jgi:hypothetical protein